ncbi:hypothetical protein UFOVP898_74 [uncultured Caudovirales phage]|uniref:Uncharacterized protein n=1 Tax=uncultured Caudovirales phage TaxID=2100421 RepID=A0A6J7XB65_9CAUD|nr:hypothetical protein UFOVP898_74 [uncultured Caudovirales phage]CAB4176776.1 hypothetical protein UFOVP985_59 [uncultured Caudovirales phage]CAB4181879.1 hypothetical protein UFOVP1073_72 [uncultured Caudovirales phage]CAB4197879.1 hypothetical protein UFOVP1308_37 [uncultured Caudovirales phage]CAB4210607.1 hypothetical protein UFOVP1423_32 [uncultured Caudovirales phage]
MILKGEHIPNTATRTVADMVQDCPEFKAVVVGMWGAGLDLLAVGEFIKFRVKRAMGTWMKDCDCPFVVSAVETSLRSAVDWTTVASIVVSYEESN